MNLNVGGIILLILAGVALGVLLSFTIITKIYQDNEEQVIISEPTDETTPEIGLVPLLSEIRTEDDVKAFLENFPFGMIIAYYAIKEDNKELWGKYWEHRYNEYIDMIDIDEGTFLTQINLAFDDIQSNTFNLGDYEEFFLDGSIIWSNGSLIEKENACQLYLSDNQDEVAISACIDKSRLYEIYVRGNGSCLDLVNPEFQEYCIDLRNL
ncbi:hypothetical protein LAT59_03885 [Candidatus Gracilibacteria bacterium]|nr:hypothetical protein [Candidatus Gracilibacteria bacterium]